MMDKHSARRFRSPLDSEVMSWEILTKWASRLRSLAKMVMWCLFVPYMMLLLQKCIDMLMNEMDSDSQVDLLYVGGLLTGCVYLKRDFREDVKELVGLIKKGS